MSTSKRSSAYVAATVAAICADAGAAFLTPALPSEAIQRAGAVVTENSRTIRSVVGSGSAHAEGLSSTSALPVAAAVAAFVGCFAKGKDSKRTKAVVQRQATTRAQWINRVKRIEGGRAVFDVTINKPLGLVPRDFPNRPGVGVAQIKPDGNTDQHNKDCILEGKEGMFVLEGDEVVAVNGVDCEGQGLDVVGGLVKGAEGDTITLKLVRNYQVGPVKVVWWPGPYIITMKRGILLRKGAETSGAEVKYGCRDGFCSSCWHAEEGTNLIHRICKLNIPKNWDNVQPLILLRSDVFKKRTGMCVLNMMQVDGMIPPPPVGVDGKQLRREMTADREAGGNGKTMFTISAAGSGWYDEDSSGR